MTARTLLMQMARRKLPCINSSGLPVNPLDLIKLSSLLSAQTDTHAGMCLFVGVWAFFCRHSNKHNSLAGFRQPGTPASCADALGTNADCSEQGFRID